MLFKPEVIIHETRPIERRGKKRASPMVEMSLSYREEILAHLMALQAYISAGEVTFTGLSDADVESVITNLGHAIKQRDFKRSKKQ